MDKCFLCNGEMWILDPDAYDWGMREAYGIPQKQESKPLKMMVPCPVCNIPFPCSIKIEFNCSGNGSDVCWPLMQRLKKQGRAM